MTKTARWRLNRVLPAIVYLSVVALPLEQLFAQPEVHLPAMLKNLETEWEDITTTLYCSDGASRQVKARKAIYNLTNPTGKPVATIPITVFLDSKSSKIYIGPASDFYFETKSCIVGGQVIQAAIRWWDSFAKGANNRDLREAITRFQSEVPAEQLMGATNVTTWPEELPLLNSPKQGPGGPRSPNAKPQTNRFLAGELTDGLLRVDIKGSYGISTGRLWINPNTRRIVKAAQDGKQTFPEEK